jgi:polysaccharide export outer membrane protein
LAYKKIKKRNLITYKGDVVLKRRLLWNSICLFFLFVISDAIAADLVYTIGPGDTLEISVWRDESLSREVTVPPDGVISFPLIGDVNVVGMTVANLRQKVTKELSDYVPDATVTVILKTFNSLRAFVIGKVRNPGMFPISLETSVMQILSMAGGLNPYASENNIHILRQVNGNSVKIPFSYSDVLKGRNLKQNITLKRGDVIVVP